MAKTKRLPVLKTYKLYIGGKFPRTESGRYYSPEGPEGPMGNICLGSRKDFRNAVVAARGAVSGWSSKTAFNRGQILYRIAEILEGRASQFIEELVKSGVAKKDALLEVETSIDRLIHYAGWSDKFQQVFSAVNPVASSHFNFTVQEPTGVVVAVCPEKPSLLGLVSNMAPALVGGNTCILLASEALPLSAITFAEVLNASDVPGGVVNILTGKRSELLSHFGGHMDVNAVIYCGEDQKEIKALKEDSASNVKRVVIRNKTDWWAEQNQNPYLILNTTEAKTTWHPIEQGGGSAAGY